MQTPDAEAPCPHPGSERLGPCSDCRIRYLRSELAALRAERAGRDAVIRELAEALRRLDLRHMLGDEPSEKQAKTDGLDAIARVDAMTGGEQQDAVCSCGKPDQPRGPWHPPGRCAMYAGALDLPVPEQDEVTGGEHADA